MIQGSRPDAGHTFRRRFAAGEALLGTFIKTPTSHAIEILGDIGFDFVVIDEEHAPFDRTSTDVALFAARASGTAGLVRVAEARASSILSALDCGASGILVPHVSSVDMAKDIVAWSRYRGGRRGYSGSGRAGRYGAASLWTNVDEQDGRTTVIAMIEDPEALQVIDQIACVDGLDGVFIGRGDLTVALGAASNAASEVRDAVGRVLTAARSAAKPACVMVGSAAEAKGFRELGVSAFIVSSDQGFMRRAASEALQGFRGIAQSAQPA